MAPLYDILPVRLDSAVTHDFSFRIGNAERFDSLTRADIATFFAGFGLSTAAAARFVSGTVLPMLSRIDQVCNGLAAHGLKDFDDLIGREAGRLIELLGVSVAMRDRDYYSPSAGGWRLSS